MITEPVKISQSDIRRLLSAANPDAALLYLYINSGNRPEDAEADLHFSAPRYGCAAATLRQLGLWPEDRPSHIAPGERPSYCEKDVLDAMDSDNTFRSLYGEVQRLLGRSLNTEELKILLGFVRYLGLTADVISLLVCYCKERARQRGSLRNPSLRTIEKEAYNWAERGIDTVEEAAAFIQAQNVRNSRLSRLMNLIQIRGRSLTAAEERYAQSWLDMGMDDELISMAYERTCLNTGALSFGGGYAAMPLIQAQIVTEHQWLSMSEFTDLVTIAEMTPGPIAVNSATFVGTKIAGVPGALVATAGCILPACILVTLIAKLYLKYRNIAVLQSVLGSLRPAVVAMIASAGVLILRNAFWSGAIRLPARTGIWSPCSPRRFCSCGGQSSVPFW